MASASYFWAKILAFIEEKHSAAIVTTWLDDVDVIELKNDTLVLFTANPFRKPYIETQCLPYIDEATSALWEKKFQIKVLDEAGLKEYRSDDRNNEGLDAIKKEFTFDNFVVGSSNRFAHAAAVAVSDRPGEVYNPLLIYGESGLGKTHLLYAIANAIKEKHRGDQKPFHIVYVKGDQFTNELIEAISKGENIQFRSKYRTADLFLMDDIQFIAGKESTQEEFFHTFNTLYEGKKQIVLTSDRPPDSMSKLEDRLRTRFQWGLLADIQPPDYETRVAIVEKKASSIGLQLPADVISYIAENVTSNVRQLEGTVNRIKAYRDINHTEINLTNVSRAIKDMFKGGSEKILPTPQLIIAEVSTYYNLSESVIRGTARNKNTTEARQISMYLIRNMTNLSLEDIAVEFGKDHTTVMYSVSKIEQSAISDEHVKTVIKEITANINGKLNG